MNKPELTNNQQKSKRMRPFAAELKNFYSDNWRKNCTLVLFGAGVLLYLVGLSTDYWAHSGIMNYGLWRNCRGFQGCELFQAEFEQDWMVQGGRCMIVAGVLLVLATAVLVLQSRKRRDLHPLDTAADLQWPVGFSFLVLIAGFLVLSTVRIFYYGVFFPASLYLSWFRASLLAGLFTELCLDPSFAWTGADCGHLLATLSDAVMSECGSSDGLGYHLV